MVWRLTPQFSGGALSYVQWHFIHDRPLQLLQLLVTRYLYVVARSRLLNPRLHGPLVFGFTRPVQGLSVSDDPRIVLVPSS